MTNISFMGLRTVLSSIAAAGALVGCGGGGGSNTSPNQGAGGNPTVSTAVAGTPMFGKPLVLTLTGANLDQGISVSAKGCSDVTIDVSSSGPSTAQYGCTVSAMGAGQFVVTRSSGDATLSTIAFNVPAPQVTMDFSNGAGVAGEIVLTLAPDKAPITVGNFLSNVNSGFYTGTVFDGVRPGFAVQGGGYTAPLDADTQDFKLTGASIPLEVGKGLSNTQWTIAMAQASTSDPASATSEFFINLGDNSGSLDPGAGPGFAVFGTVTSGTADVTAIVGAPCTAIPLFLPSGECTPTPNMVITSVLQTQ